MKNFIIHLFTIILTLILMLPSYLIVFIFITIPRKIVKEIFDAYEVVNSRYTIFIPDWLIRLNHLLNLRQYKKDEQEWYEQNCELGLKLGYPQCCIREFCSQPPSMLRKESAHSNDKLRYKASFINGEYSGFIPCTKHSKEILSGKITLDSLIWLRDKNCPPFPNWDGQNF